MIQPNAKCVVNGPKVNEVIGVINNILKVAISEELDVVDPSNQPGKRWFLTGKMTGQDQQYPGNNRDELDTGTGSGSGSNRESLMPLADGPRLPGAGLPPNMGGGGPAGIPLENGPNIPGGGGGGGGTSVGGGGTVGGPATDEFANVIGGSAGQLLDTGTPMAPPPGALLYTGTPMADPLAGTGGPMPLDTGTPMADPLAGTGGPMPLDTGTTSTGGDTPTTTEGAATSGTTNSALSLAATKLAQAGQALRKAEREDDQIYDASLGMWRYKRDGDPDSPLVQVLKLRLASAQREYDLLKSRIDNS